MGGSASYRLAKKIASARANGALESEINDLERQQQIAKEVEKASRQALRQINHMMADYESESVINEYLYAIDKRSRKDVLRLDGYYMKESEWDTNEQKASKKEVKKLRKALLDVARYSPETVTKIKKQTESKFQKRVEDNWNKINNTLSSQELALLKNSISNMNIGHYNFQYYIPQLNMVANLLGIDLSGKSLATGNGILENALGRKLWRGKTPHGRF